MVERERDLFCIYLRLNNARGLIYGDHRLWNVDAWVLVPHKVDVRNGQILAGEASSGVADLVVPLVLAVSQQQGSASFGSKSVSFDGSIWLARCPVIELKTT